jgi:hypothetical protein
MKHYFIYLVAKSFFVGPHFCITKLCLNRASKVGVLQVLLRQYRSTIRSGTTAVKYWATTGRAVPALGIRLKINGTRPEVPRYYQQTIHG